MQPAAVTGQWVLASAAYAVEREIFRPRRVAKVLLSQPRDDDGVIGQKMTQEEFAHRVGGARQSVNAALRGFERRGWIQVRNQAVTVKQAAALSRFAGD